MLFDTHNLKLVGAILHASMSSKYIPPDQIQKGIDTCLKQNDMLLSASKILFDARKYGPSLALAILAIEEAAETRYLLKKRDKNLGVTDEEWRHITRGSKAHDTKLLVAP